MARAPLPPTPEQTRIIANYIRSGGYPHVAAEAAGIAADVYDFWMQQGQKPTAGTALREFYEAVRAARAQARIKAELEAYKHKPLDWLKSGPGKENADAPGWSATVKARQASEHAPLNVLEHPELLEVFGALIDALSAYPEARAAASKVLAEKGAEAELPKAGAR
jgi:hypothetical protein